MTNRKRKLSRSLIYRINHWFFKYFTEKCTIPTRYWQNSQKSSRFLTQKPDKRLKPNFLKSLLRSDLLITLSTEQVRFLKRLSTPSDTRYARVHPQDLIQRPGPRGTKLAFQPAAGLQPAKWALLDSYRVMKRRGRHRSREGGKKKNTWRENRRPKRKRRMTGGSWMLKNSWFSSLADRWPWRSRSPWQQQRRH